MRSSKKEFSLQTKIIIFISITIFITLGFIGVSSYKILHNSVEESVGNYTLKVARILSKMDSVQEALKATPDENKLQEAYDEYLSEVSYKEQIFIVLIDQEGVRYTHPNNELIGKRITGDDINAALRGDIYVSKARGISGTTIRTFVPVIDSQTSEQLGVISIGILHEDILKVISKYVHSLFFWIIITLFIGILAALLFSKRIKHILHGFEPYEIASLFREKEAILESMSEGIIATDNEERITLVNSAAKEILSLKENLIGQKLTNVKPFSLLVHIMKTEKVNENIEIAGNHVIIVASYYPMFSENNEVLGSIITFRDITEVQEMADKLTGVEQYVDGLRSKTHEFMNKLQTLSGLIELKRYEEVLEYITTTTLKQQELLHFLNQNIHEPKLTGLLLGKFQQAEELHIEMVFTPGSYLGLLPRQIPTNSIVLIIGNLIQNAIEAVVDTSDAEIHVTILDGDHSLEIIVEDNGTGISDFEISQIFTRGYSTKGEGRGIGLHLIKHHVEHILNGTLLVESSTGEGTSFYITIPKK